MGPGAEGAPRDRKKMGKMKKRKNIIGRKKIR